MPYWVSQDYKANPTAGEDLKDNYLLGKDNYNKKLKVINKPSKMSGCEGQWEWLNAGLR